MICRRVGYQHPRPVLTGPGCHDRTVHGVEPQTCPSPLSAASVYIRDDGPGGTDGTFICQLPASVPEYQHMPDRTVHAVSDIYEAYIETFPDSPIARSFKEDGVLAAEAGTSFHQYLFDGEVWNIMRSAPKAEQVRVAVLLQRYGYDCIRLDDEIVQELMAEDQISDTDLEPRRQVPMHRIVEQARENCKEKGRCYSCGENVDGETCPNCGVEL